MENDFKQAIAFVESVTWEHWRNVIRVEGKVRSRVVVPFGAVDFYELVPMELVRVEWTARSYESNGLRFARRELERIVRSDERWSEAQVWGDLFYQECDEDAVVVHRWSGSDVYLSLRHEGEGIPIRVCINRNIVCPV